MLDRLLDFRSGYGRFTKLCTKLFELLKNISDAMSPTACIAAKVGDNEAIMRGSAAPTEPPSLDDKQQVIVSGRSKRVRNGLRF